MVFLLITVAIIAAIFFFFKKKFQEIPESASPEETPLPAQELPVELPVEDIQKRLNKMISPDSNKPFAKISVPDVSEIPTDMEIVESPRKKKGKKKKNVG